MDVDDWYLNLEIRGQIHRNGTPYLLQRVRGVQPLVFRHEEDDIDAMLLQKCVTSQNFKRVFSSSALSEAVKNQTVWEHYFFEKWITPSIREFAKNYDPKITEESPPEFQESINDHLKKQPLNRIVTINLSAPDEQIIDSLKRYLATERQHAQNVAPVSPHAAALRALQKRNVANLDTWGKRRVLPYMDLSHWAKEAGTKVTNGHYAELLQISEEQLRETKNDAQLLFDQFVLDAWLLPRLISRHTVT